MKNVVSYLSGRFAKSFAFSSNNLLRQNYYVTTTLIHPASNVSHAGHTIFKRLLNTEPSHGMRKINIGNNLKQAENRIKTPKNDAEICRIKEDTKSFQEDWGLFKSKFTEMTKYQWGKGVVKAIIAGVGIIGLGVDTLLEPQIKGSVKRLKFFLGYDEEIKHIAPSEWDKTKLIERNATKQLEKLFEEGNFKQGITCVTIIGAEGSGKSEIANEYANKYYSKVKEIWPENVRTVKVLYADNLLILELEYRKFAEELGVDVRNKKELREIINCVNNALESRKNWLIVFDNVNEIYSSNSVDKKEEFSGFSVIKSYIPQGNDQKGQIIITTRREKITRDRKDLWDTRNILIFDLNKEVNKFTEHEAVQLFNTVLGEFGDKGWKEKASLARELGFLPLAIRKAAALIVHSKTINDVKTYQEEFIKQKNEQNSDYTEQQRINLATNLLAISELSIEAKAIISSLIFFNPDKIEELVFALKDITFSTLKGSIKNLSKEELSEKLMELKALYLLDRNDGTSYKMHRSVKEAVIKWGAKETNKEKSVYELDKLDSVLSDISKYCKRSGFQNTELANNSILVPHIQTIFECVMGLKVQTDKEEQFHKMQLNAIFSLIAVGNYCAYMGEIAVARQLLEKAKAACDEVAEVSINITSDTPTLCKNLVGDNKGTYTPKLPTLYAATLYHLGRLYFYTKDLKDFISADKYIKKAVKIRKEIAEDQERNLHDKVGYDDDQIFNEQGVDGHIFYQNGELFLLIEPYSLDKDGHVHKKAKQQRWNDYTQAKGEYQRFLLEYANDSQTKIICYQQIARINQELAKITTNSSDRRQYYQIALDNINKGIGIAKQKAPAKMSDYYNTKVFINLDIQTPESLEEAEKILDQVLNSELAKNHGKGSRGSTMADTYKGLAILYYQKGLQDDAKRAIEESIKIQQEMKRSDNHPDLKEAETIRKNIITYMRFKTIEEKSIGIE